MKSLLREAGRPFVTCTLLISILAIGTTLFIVGRYEREQTTSYIKARMVASVELRKARLVEHINQLRHDAQFLANVPPIQGMVRAINHNGVDAQENTSLKFWQERLSKIFAEFSKANPDLTMIRFIGIADDGMELVRINRNQGNVVVVPQDQLQTKGKRDFFRSVLTLKPGQSFVSNLDLNQEHGKIEEPAVRTILAAVPVFSEDGAIFGLVVLNRDTQSDLAELKANSALYFQHYLLNSDGDYLLNPNPHHTFGFEYGKQWRWQNDFRFNSTDHEQPLPLDTFTDSGGKTIHVVKAQIPLDENDPSRFLTFAITVQDKTIEQAVINAQINSLLVILGASLLAGGAMYFYWWKKRSHDKKRSEMVAIVENSHDAIIGKTLDGIVTSWNTGANEMFGYSSTEALGQRLVDLIVPRDRHNEETEILKKLSKGEKISGFESVRHRKDGTLLDVSITVSPILSSSGKVIGAAKMARNISQKKQAEQYIRDLNRNLEIQVADRTAKIHRYAALQHAILDNAGYAMIATDQDGLITIFNPAAERMFGYTADELIGKQNPGIFHEHGEVAERARSISAELNEHFKPGFEMFVAKTRRGLLNEAEWTFVRKDGTQFPALLSITALRGDDNTISGFLGIAIDLTERKTAETALKAQNRFLDTLADNLPGLVSYWDRDFRCRFANHNWYEWFGRTSHEMQGITLRTALGETLYQKSEWYILAAYEGKPQRFERSHIQKDGSLRQALVHYIPDLDDGVVRGMIALVNDISELKQVQKKLEELNSSLEKRSGDLERTGQMAGVGAWSFDLQKKMVNWSKQTIRIFELPVDYQPTAEEAVGFFTGDAQPVIRSTLDNAIRTLQPWDIELPAITAKGCHIWIRSVGEVELSEEGRAIRLVGAFQDITERRRWAEVLTSTRDQLLVAAKVAGLGIWSWALADNSLEWNDLMFEMYDQPISLKNAGLNFDHWRQRVHPDDQVATLFCLSEAVEGRGTFDSIFRIVRRNGEVRYLKAGSFIEKNDLGKAQRVIGINMDITAQLLLESGLRQAKESADAANVAKSEFLANMSHEIRTPMNAILGMLQLLQHTGLDHRQIDYVSKTEVAAKSLLSILNDILDFSKVEVGKMVLDPHPFSIDKLLRDIAVILSANVGNKDVEVLFEIDPTLPKWIVGDDLRLQQILINLAGNAIKFTEHGEIVLSVKLVSSGESDITIHFSVRDTGIGISPEQCEHIFEGFSQAEASTARRYGGSGLGLAISQRLVQLMGGTLDVSSAVNVGSAFHFTLICKRSEQIQEPGKKHLIVDTQFLRCLVVEDNPTARQIFAEMLRSLGWEVETASSGQVAIDMVVRRSTKNPYDVIFVDWRMSGMDGWKLCEHIRKKTPDHSATIIVMVTAHSYELIAQRTAQMASLFDGVLVKPVTASMMYDAVADSRASKGKVIPIEVSPSIQQQRLTGLRILVVEDNVTNQQVARELLANDGATVVVVDGGKEGIDAIQSAKPQFDVVLMDVQMPDMDGYTATKIIRTNLGKTSLPIIAITANAMPSDRDTAFAAGMTDHVGKPYEMSQLVTVILRHTRSNGTAHVSPNGELHTDESPSKKDFDAKSALVRLGGKSKIYQSALNGFIREMAEFKLEYKELIQNQLRDDARRMFHTIKGLAATVGANRLSALAGTEEKYIKDPSNIEPLKELDAFWLTADRAIESAKQQLNCFEDIENVAVRSGQIDLLPLRDALTQLLLLLQSSDLDAEQKYQQLKRQCAAAFPAEYKEMGHCIEKLEFKNAGAICKEILSKIDG